MRSPVDKDKLRHFMRDFGRSVRSPGAVYLAGGATAVWYEWRPQTVDIDFRFDPEPKDAYPVLRELMDRLDLHAEPATPHDFLPPLPGWQERSPWITREGEVDFFHYDLYSQALSKIARGFDKDLADASSMMESGEVDPERLRDLFERIRPGLVRFPRIDEDALRDTLEAAVAAFVSGRDE